MRERSGLCRAHGGRVPTPRCSSLRSRLLRREVFQELFRNQEQFTEQQRPPNRPQMLGIRNALSSSAIGDYPPAT
jgi:hypothetical protein